MVRGPGIFESYEFVRQTAFAVTCSLAHSSMARWKGILSECKTSHIAITEHVGSYVVTMMLDLKSGFLIWSSLANNLDLDGTRVYAVVTHSFTALPLISSCPGQYSIKLVWAHTRWPHSLSERDKTAFLIYMSDYSCSVYAHLWSSIVTNLLLLDILS